jgi:hypothetical protein
VSPIATVEALVAVFELFGQIIRLNMFRYTFRNQQGLPTWSPERYASALYTLSTFQGGRENQNAVVWCACSAPTKNTSQGCMTHSLLCCALSSHAAGPTRLARPARWVISALSTDQQVFLVRIAHAQSARSTTSSSARVRQQPLHCGWQSKASHALTLAVLLFLCCIFAGLWSGGILPAQRSSTSHGYTGWALCVARGTLSHCH